MSFIDDYRKILGRRIKEYHWNNIQTEIDSFFNIVQRITIPDQADGCLKKILLSYDKILAKFYLNEKRVKDIIYLDRIHEMLIYIKEINFCFPNNWNTHSYHHHNHGYTLKNLIMAIEDELEDLIHFKVDKFDLLVETPQNFQTTKKLIDINFGVYDLGYYALYVNLINGIAYDNDFYMTLPHLLRTLFENLLQDIFSQSLVDSCSDLYYNKPRRYRDFSKLITLLDLLKDDEFGPYISGKITNETIKELGNIREKGNISIHDIGDKITPDYADEIKDKIIITLTPLLVAYKKLNGKNIFVERNRKYKIKLKLGIIKKETERKKKKIKKKKEKKRDIKIEDNLEISNLMSEIRLLIDKDSLDIVYIRSKMDKLLLNAKSLIDKRQREALGKAYVLFNSVLFNPPMKKTLQTLFDAINIIILGR